MADLTALIQERLRAEYAADPSFYEPSPGQLVDHVHNRVARVVTDGAVRWCAQQPSAAVLGDWPRIAAEYLEGNDMTEPELPVVECPTCGGSACEEGCGQCDYAQAGPESHKVCVRCRGAGVVRASDENGPGRA